ncbi:MAG: iron-sulfur cluster assembly scaffold protein, partial [Puniceicoccales bacterium]|nr:iron-sulfur cluster assembly scaffold protein [Puniceicoccales bacterium]
MGDLDELYEDVILEHSRSPRNFGKLDNPHRRAEGYNASCGDGIEVFIHFDGENIGAIKFSGDGCAISRASASLMTESVAGLRKSDAIARAAEVVAARSGSGSDNKRG